MPAFLKPHVLTLLGIQEKVQYFFLQQIYQNKNGSFSFASCHEIKLHSTNVSLFVLWTSQKHFQHSSELCTLISVIHSLLNSHSAIHSLLNSHSAGITLRTMLIVTTLAEFTISDTILFFILQIAPPTILCIYPIRHRTLTTVSSWNKLLLSLTNAKFKCFL